MDALHLDDFFENAAMPMHWVGPQGIILRANRAELEMLGYAREEYVGRNIAEFHADAPVIHDILVRLKGGQTLRDYPAVLRCKNGGLKHVRITSNVHWHEGRFLHTRCFTRDVTEQIDHLEGLMEGFVAYDAHWLMTYMNAAAERILGRRREDVLGKTWHEAFPHAVGNPVDHMYQRVMRTRAPERMEYHYAHYGRWLEISASPVRTGGVAVYFRDISERKHAEWALQDAARRKDEFLAMLSHELRNPLAPIRTGLDLLRAAPLPATVAQVRTIMERQVGQLTRLVDDLLEVSRISSGKIELRRETVDLGTVVASGLETSRGAIEAAHHTLEVTLPREPLYVDADLVRLTQVVANLLNNAAKYTNAGGSIALEARRENGHAVISVRDNGIGISAELLPRVFDMFAQADRARSGSGLGVGLTLVKRLVELHGGEVHARSAGPGQGSEFVVRLPLRG